MVECDWSADIKVQAIALNYSHPKHFRSSVVVAHGDVIHLKDYKEIYDESPSLAITKLTRAVQTSMQEQLTYIEQKDLAPFLENILILSRKGMNHFHHDASIPVEKRYYFSQRVANKINAEYKEEDPKWKSLSEGMSSYFKRLKKEKINENWVHRYSQTKSKKSSLLFIQFLLTLPITIIGLVHQLIPYLLIKRFVENTFKRDVFWSGVKLLLGATLSTLYNLVFIFLFYAYVFPSYWLAIGYFLIVPVLTGMVAYIQINGIKDAIAYKKASESILQEFTAEREGLLAEINELGLSE
jgi:hypothetical protein